MHDAIKAYVKTLAKALESGITTEHTHRSTLEALIKALNPKLQVINEAKRIQVGSPDLVIRKPITKGEYLPLGYIETKDVGVKLDEIEKTDQLQRYKRLSNLILTDYLEFRWFVDGKHRLTVTLASYKKGKLKIEAEGEEKLLNLLESFLDHEVEDIKSPKELAAKMAGYCKNIDGIIAQSFADGSASALMQDLKSAFERTLLPDITDAQFSDMFAQTLGYGLFAARIQHSDSPLPAGGARGVSGATPFTRTGAAREIPKSNPFLRNLFDTMHSADLEDEPFIGFVDDLTAVLAHSNIGEILAQFGRRTKQEDPILHFYETFLSEYDPKERKRRGVYYTPEPVVSYIVRSVDILLKEKFGLKDGLADTSTIEVEVKEGDKFVKRKLPKVLILDPACGTGTFLYAVVDLIRTRFMERNDAGSWQMFVKDHLIPRIYGFELQMAPYAVAHLKLAMQLAGHDLDPKLREKWGYEIGKVSDPNQPIELTGVPHKQHEPERLHVYLTNSLEESFHKAEEFFGSMRIITQETNAAANVKNRLPIMVVLGNPPYAGHSANRSEITEIIVGRKVTRPSFIGEKLRTYYRVDGRPLDEKNPKWLQDDYVKFLRFGQWRIAEMHLDDQPAKGILAFITNHSYLDNPTFRGMRRSLQTSFDDIYILDLHGNSKKKEKSPDGTSDENVFDIQQGVSIGLFVKTRKGEEDLGKRVHRADLWGKRDVKYKWLGAHDHKVTDWAEIEPSKPFYLFTERSVDEEVEFNESPSIQDVLLSNSVGIVTARDDLVIQWNPEDAFAIAKEFSGMDTEEARTKYSLGDDVRDWKVQWAQQDVLESGVQPEFVTPILYRPFDIRHAYYTGNSRGFMCYPRSEVMRHMLAGENLGMLTTRQTKDEWSPYVSRTICTHKSASVYDISSVFPLYLYPADGSTRRPNLDAKFVAEFAGKLGLTFVEEGGKWTGGSGAPAAGAAAKKVIGKVGQVKTPAAALKGAAARITEFGPEDIFYYIYAVFHSPTYRERYKEFLKIDFPRVPLTSSVELFSKLVPLGYELVQYHLLEHPKLAHAPVVFPEKGDNVVAKVEYNDHLKRVYINKKQWFEPVAPEVWEFHVGGYQVCQKWLKDRKERTLTYDEIKHYAKTVMALGETIGLMKEIDAAIPEWPIG